MGAWVGSALYDAFVSYSHALDGALAPALQTARPLADLTSSTNGVGYLAFSPDSGTLVTAAETGVALGDLGPDAGCVPTPSGWRAAGPVRSGRASGRPTLPASRTRTPAPSAELLDTAVTARVDSRH